MEIKTSADRMLSYYPDVIKSLLEFQALMAAEGAEIDAIKAELENVLDDAYLQTMRLDRIQQWEKALGLAVEATDTIEDRRDAIIARLRVSGKLNTAMISNIVGAFTNGSTAVSYIKDGVLHVKINPPANNKQYKFANVERELLLRIPAHLGLSVTRNYATWGEIKDNFATWSKIAEGNTWEDLLLYISPQEV